MSSLSYLAKQVSDILKAKKDAEATYKKTKELKDTTAKACTYLGNGMIMVDGQATPASICSDVTLTKGYTVFCLPTKGGGWVIVGSGA